MKSREASERAVAKRIKFMPHETSEETWRSPFTGVVFAV
jgi:hypothetical protein